MCRLWLRVKQSRVRAGKRWCWNKAGFLWCCSRRGTALRAVFTVVEERALQIKALNLLLNPFPTLYLWWSHALGSDPEKKKDRWHKQPEMRFLHRVAGFSLEREQYSKLRGLRYWAAVPLHWRSSSWGGTDCSDQEHTGRITDPPGRAGGRWRGKEHLGCSVHTVTTKKKKNKGCWEKLWYDTDNTNGYA